MVDRQKLNTFSVDVLIQRTRLNCHGLLIGYARVTVHCSISYIRQLSLCGRIQMPKQNVVVCLRVLTRHSRVVKRSEPQRLVNGN